LRIIFTADDGALGRELWSFSGPELAPRLVLDGTPGAAGTAWRILGPLADGRVALGYPGGQLWVTDGSGPGTSFVLRAPDSSWPEYGGPVFERGGGLLPNGVLLVTLTDFMPWRAERLEVRGTWATDGSAAGSFPLLVPDAATSLALPGGRLLAAVASPGWDEFTYVNVWVTDGTLEGTAGLASDIGWSHVPAPVGDGSAVFVLGDYFIVGYEPWITDGTVEGTRLLKDINPGSGSSFPGLFLPFGDGRLIFFANDGTHGSEPWITDGTEENTRLLADISPGAAGSAVWYFGYTGLSLGDGRVLFAADDGTHGAEWWISDGTGAGTRLFADINPGAGGSNPTFVAALGGGRFAFLANDGTHGRELWVTDGSADGTRLLADIRQGTGSGFLARDTLSLSDGRLLFVADDGIRGAELWVTDGTPEGTRLVADIRAGAGDSSPSLRSTVVNGRDPEALALGDGRAIFLADDGVHGREPWITDGTPEGTRLLADLRPGSAGSQASGFILGPPGPLLLAALPERWAVIGQAFSFDLPPGAFDLPDPVRFSATLSDGGGLPAWLSFDAEGGALSGIAPSGAPVHFAITLTATDEDGLAASGQFELLLRDPFRGTSRADTIAADPDRPAFIEALGGNDTVFGSDGADEINGGAGHDVLWGNAGDDLILGRNGNDVLWGGEGDDVLRGGDGDDVLIGGPGQDRLQGGPGADVFRFLDVSESVRGRADRIVDFEPGVDLIDLSAIDADGDASNGDTAFAWIGGARFSAPGQLRGVELESGRWLIEANTEGSSGAEMSIVVTAPGPPTEAWFLL